MFLREIYIVNQVFGKHTVTYTSSKVKKKEKGAENSINSHTCKRQKKNYLPFFAKFFTGLPFLQYS